MSVSFNTRSRRSLIVRIMKHYTRPINELWQLWEFRARSGIHPFDFTLFER